MSHWVRMDAQTATGLRGRWCIGAEGCCALWAPHLSTEGTAHRAETGGGDRLASGGADGEEEWLLGR